MGEHNCITRAQVAVELTMSSGVNVRAFLTMKGWLSESLRLMRFAGSTITHFAMKSFMSFENVTPPAFGKVMSISISLTMPMISVGTAEATCLAGILAPERGSRMATGGGKFRCPPLLSVPNRNGWYPAASSKTDRPMDQISHLAVYLPRAIGERRARIVKDKNYGR